MAEQAADDTSPIPGLGPTVYLLGSGASLLELTDQDKAYLANQPVVAMNKYLMFWEKIGLWPTHTYLADGHYPGPVVYESVRKLYQQSNRPLHFLLSQFYRATYRLPIPWPGDNVVLMRLVRNLRHHRHVPRWWQTPPADTTYFQWRPTLDNQSWGPHD